VWVILIAMSERPTARELASIYRRAGSVTGVAAQLGVAYETARRWLVDAGVTLRTRGRPSPGADAAPVDEIVERYRKGESFAAIASLLDVSPNTVRNRVIEAGEPVRPRPGWKR
jgi:transposase-like protein